MACGPRGPATVVRLGERPWTYRTTGRAAYLGRPHWTDGLLRFWITDQALPRLFIGSDLLTVSYQGDARPFPVPAEAAGAFRAGEPWEALLDWLLETYPDRAGWVRAALEACTAASP